MLAGPLGRQVGVADVMEQTSAHGPDLQEEGENTATAMSHHSIPGPRVAGDSR